MGSTPRPALHASPQLSSCRRTMRQPSRAFNPNASASARRRRRYRNDSWPPSAPIDRMASPLGRLPSNPGGRDARTSATPASRIDGRRHGAGIAPCERTTPSRRSPPSRSCTSGMPGSGCWRRRDHPPGEARGGPPRADLSRHSTRSERRRVSRVPREKGTDSLAARQDVTAEGHGQFVVVGRVPLRTGVPRRRCAN